jgi:hypothetical protein
VNNSLGQITPQSQPLAPHNLEAEQSLIGAMLREHQAVETATATLTAADFYHQTHRIIFDCITAMHRRGDTTDFITVGEELRRQDQLGDDSGQVSAAYLQGCIEACPSAANIEAYAKIVRELSHKRQVLILTAKARDQALNGVGSGVALTELRKGLDELEADIGAAAPEFCFNTFKGMAKLPRLLWLIRGLLIEKTCSVLNGDSGTFKTFIALCMALSVATGRAFFGREVKQGAVVYVAAEGFYTLYERALAWSLHHECELPDNFHILDLPVNMADADAVKRFADAVLAFEPALIILDTLSQCATGLVENSNEDMARFVGGMMHLGRRAGVHVLTTHHNAKATGNLRGAGAIHNNIDARISLDLPESGEDTTVFVRCEKQRGKQFKSFALRGVEIVLPITDEYGDAVTSLVFEPCDDEVTPKTEKHHNAKKADKTTTALLAAFDEVAREAAELGIDGVKTGFWKAKVEEAEPSFCPPSTFWRHRKALLNSKVIEEVGTHKGSPLLKRVSPTLTTLTTLIESNESEPARDSHQQLSQLSHPLRGESNESRESAGENEAPALPEMPAAKRKRTPNAAADSEAYKSNGKRRSKVVVGE